MSAAIDWTNESVLKFADGHDPISAIQMTARAVVLEAVDHGWHGPPFSPIELARLLGIGVVANMNVVDARTVFQQHKPIIEYNPRQSRSRVRFSIAHEIGHTLFPDASDTVRYRSGPPSAADGWQLELLCNLAASEFVLPFGSLPSSNENMSIEKLMEDRVRYDVSTEAYLIRVARSAQSSVAAFSASPLSVEEQSRYQIDYVVSSAIAPKYRWHGMVLSEDSAVSRCTAIGYTDRGLENWGTPKSTQIECVGIPGYPGSLLPRVAGLIRFDAKQEGHSPISYFHGDALKPRGNGKKLVCQLVNDQAYRWGGGFAREAAQRFPTAEREFTAWISSIAREKRLGRVHISRSTDGVAIASLVAQSGFGKSELPRIRYQALEQCFRTISTYATSDDYSVHMPKIGTGVSGGTWESVADIINDTLVATGTEVIVYGLPPTGKQMGLFD